MQVDFDSISQVSHSSGESTVQDGRAHVQGHSWNCAVIPESTGSCRRSAWSTFPPLCLDKSSAGTVRETVYRRRPGLPGRPIHHLEQPAGQREICPVSVNLPSAFNKKLSYLRGTARCVVSVEICQFQRNSAEPTYSTSPDQIDGMKLEI